MFSHWTKSEFFVCLCVYRVVEQLHDKCGHTAINTNEEVNAGKDHIGCARDTEHERGRIHHRSDGPSVTTQQHKPHKTSVFIPKDTIKTWICITQHKFYFDNTNLQLKLSSTQQTRNRATQ